MGRVQGKVVSKYVGIVKGPDNASVAEKGDVVESAAGTDVVENGGEKEADSTGESQQV